VNDQHSYISWHIISGNAELRRYCCKRFRWSVVGRHHPFVCTRAYHVTSQHSRAPPSLTSVGTFVPHQWFQQTARRRGCSTDVFGMRWSLRAVRMWVRWRSAPWWTVWWKASVYVPQRPAVLCQPERPLACCLNHNWKCSPYLASHLPLVASETHSCYEC
jgi:hypothetical protein